MKFQNTAAIFAAVAVQQAAAIPSRKAHCTPVKGNLEYIVQAEPFKFSPGVWSEFDASVFSTMGANPYSQTPYTTCKAGVSGGDNGPAQAIYGRGGPVPMEYLTIQHRGYIMSETGGDYTVTMPAAVDNALLFWTGKEAVRGYTRDNAKFNSLEGVKPGNLNKFIIPVGKGEAVPIRFMFSNAWGPGGFTIDITDPSGKSCFCNGGQQSTDCFYSEVCGACKDGTFDSAGSTCKNSF